MPAGGETLVCGSYTVTYGGVACGIMKGDAGVPTLEQTTKAVPVNKTDKYGDSLLDLVYTGTSWRAMFTCMEYKAGSLAALAPFATLGLLGIIGRLHYNMASALVLTVVAGTPAAGSPSTITASKAILAPDFPSKLLFGPMVREVPISMNLLLVDTGGGAYGHFTTT